METTILILIAQPVCLNIYPFITFGLGFHYKIVDLYICTLIIIGFKLCALLQIPFFLSVCLISIPTIIFLRLVQPLQAQKLQPKPAMSRIPMQNNET